MNLTPQSRRILAGFVLVVAQRVMSHIHLATPVAQLVDPCIARFVLVVAQRVMSHICLAAPLPQSLDPCKSGFALVAAQGVMSHILLAALTARSGMYYINLYRLIG